MILWIFLCIVGMEVAPCELDAIGEQRGGAETESTQEQGPNTVTKADGNGKIVEQLHEGSDHGGSPLKSLAGGADVRANAKGSGGKKRREDWTGEETGILLKAVSQKSKVKSRLGKGSGVSESWWEAIAKEVPNRTGNECRRRMDTLKKAYNAAMKYCDNHQKEFKELKKEDFRLMKLATRLTESWYYSIRYHCPPRSNKKTGNKGAGSSLAKGVPVLSGKANSVSISAGVHVCVSSLVRCCLTMLERVVDYQVVHHLTEFRLHCQMAH
jgi:hypothetical protein